MGSAEEISAREIKKKVLYHTTSDTGQDGLMSIASAAYKANGSQPLSK